MDPQISASATYRGSQDRQGGLEMVDAGLVFSGHSLTDWVVEFASGVTLFAQDSSMTVRHVAAIKIRWLWITGCARSGE